jgi:light-regulated signal transduction histidine kinase (bacteriophytochrome)
MDALKVLRSEGLDIPMILVSGALGDVTAVECIRQGATDYVLKDGLARLPEVVRRALREKHERMLRHQVENDLARKVDELARSNADLEQFAYVASHDLQEPLRMVTAYTQLLGERYRGKLDENADKFIGYATEGAQRMQVLIQDLLAFSRVGRNEPSSKTVDCNAVLQEVVQTLATTIQESGATVSYAELPAVWADRTQVAQLFQNLIGNAIKFRGEKPPVVAVQAEPAGERWQFSVSDNGIGIASEHAENIFVVFQRLHARTEYPGNGIGLAICKKIVERYGGKIWMESQPGQGATFKFTLPAHGPDGKHEARPDARHDAKSEVQQ